VGGLSHRLLAVGQRDVQVVDVDVIRAEVVVRRDLVLNDPPRLGDPQRPVTSGHRRGGRAHQLDGQAGFLGHLTQGGLSLGFFLLDMAARNHHQVKTRVPDQPKPPALLVPAEHEHARRQVLVGHPLILAARPDSGPARGDRPPGSGCPAGFSAG